MFKQFLLGVGAVVVAASVASAQASPAGHWEGTCTVDNHPLVLSLDLAKNAASQWVASMGVPAENATGLVVTDVVVNGNSVRFTGVELMMARFDLTLGADGRMTGTFSNGRTPVPIEFTRTGEARVELMAPSPAVSTELEGDWEGSLATPGQPIRIALHFRNQPDKTVRATFENLGMGMAPVPLNDVRQSGLNVEFGLRVGHGSFQGTLNKEGTELTGQLKHEETSMPLTLRKK